MADERLTAVYRIGSLRTEGAILGIQAIFKQHGLPLTGFSLYGKELTLVDALSRLSQSQRRTFDLTGQGFEFHYSSVPGNGFDHFTIRSSAVAKISWDELAEVILNRPGFVMAWVVDCEYDHWQNAEDLLQDTTAGRSYADLPMKSNGLPFPLEQQIIDISSNPGRHCCFLADLRLP